MTGPSPKSKRVLGEARAAMIAEVEARYRAGASIREIAKHYERSYGWVHGLVIDAGVTVRSRGGNTRSATSRQDKV